MTTHFDANYRFFCNYDFSLKKCNCIFHRKNPIWCMKLIQLIEMHMKKKHTLTTFRSFIILTEVTFHRICSTKTSATVILWIISLSSHHPMQWKKSFTKEGKIKVKSMITYFINIQDLCIEKNNGDDKTAIVFPIKYERDRNQFKRRCLKFVFYNDENRSHDTYRSFMEQWIYCVPLFIIFGLNSFLLLLLLLSIFFCWFSLSFLFFPHSSNGTMYTWRDDESVSIAALTRSFQILSALHFFIILYKSSNRRCTCYSVSFAFKLCHLIYRKQSI